MKITAFFRPYENGATKGFLDFLCDDQIGVKGCALKEGSQGLFVSFPSRKVGDEYRDIVSGVSKEFMASLVDAALAAKDAPKGVASIEVEGKVFAKPHVFKLDREDEHTKGMASLTVSAGDASEKSSFTINGFTVKHGQFGYYVNGPTIKTNSPDYPYAEVANMSSGSKNFYKNLILGEAKKVLGIKLSIDSEVKGANDRKPEAPAKDNAEKEISK